MRLGICCVYFYGPDTGWLLDLQLGYISKTLQGYDYTIYAATNRLQPELLVRLRREPRLVIVPLPLTEERESLEHAYYLDLLFRRAVADGCTHLAAVDADSFPVLLDWPRVLLERMHGRRLAAVLRCENLDTFLPHPCGIFMERSFFIERSPRMFPPKAEIAADASFQAFLKETGQRKDTGIGYGYALWRAKEPWMPLLRSNTRNRHFLMAGIYGGVFFHVGASSRRPFFHGDWEKRMSFRIGRAVTGVPLLWRLHPLLEEHYIRANRRILGRIVAALKRDPDGFLSELQTPSDERY